MALIQHPGWPWQGCMEGSGGWGSLALIQLRRGKGMWSGPDSAPWGKEAWPSPNLASQGEGFWPSPDSAMQGEGDLDWPHPNLVVRVKQVWEFGSGGGWQY